MLTYPMDVLNQHPIRKNKKQKQAFLSDVIPFAENLGYSVKVEKGKMGCKNVVIGNSDSAKYLVTAHYDTPACMLFPNFITPCNPFVYLCYQFFVVAIFLLIAFISGFAVHAFSQNAELSLLAGYVVYFGIMLLMMFGPANRHNANDNTSGVVTLLEIAAALPESQRENVCFVLFDLEEAGLLGSASYRKVHKKVTDRQIVLNLDCVGDGNEIMMFPTKKLNKDTQLMSTLDRATGEFGCKRINLHHQGFAMCPSDQKNFPLGVGIMAFQQKKFLGLFCDKIHTNRDIILEEENVNIIRSALISLICQ